MGAARTLLDQAGSGGTQSRPHGPIRHPMLAACGDVRGLQVIDSGCGEGRFCRMLIERGAAHALGVDLCAPMIDAARELASGADEYRADDVQDLSFLADGTFELAVSYLNQCDLPDFQANTREIYRVLKPNGRFVIANLHPMRSAIGNWQRSADGSKEHVILDRYFDEGERYWKMLGIDFTNFHRSLATYVRVYRESGFLIDEMLEPTIDEATVNLYPELGDERRVPNFIIFVLKKI